MFTPFLLSLAQPSSASYISLTTSASTDIAFGRSANVALAIRNLGDETAHGVAASLLESPYFQSEPLRMGDIRPQGSASGNMTLGLKAGMLPGRYVVPVLVEYADANGYPFSSVTAAVLVYESSAYSSVVGSVGEVTIGESGKAILPVNVKNLDDRPHDITLTLYLPKELKAWSGGTVSAVTVGAKDEGTVRFDIANLAGLRGSSYSVPVMIEYETGGMHYSSTATGLVEIGYSQTSTHGSAENGGNANNASNTGSGPNIIFVLIVLCVFVIAIAVYYRFIRKPRGKGVPGKKSGSMIQGKSYAETSRPFEGIVETAAENKDGDRKMLLLTVFIFLLAWTNLMQIGLTYWLSLAAALAASLAISLGFWVYSGNPKSKSKIKFPKFKLPKLEISKISGLGIVLILIILSGFAVRLYFNFKSFLPVDAGDMWDFLGDGLSVAEQNRIPNVKNVFGGVPFVDPPFLSIVISSLYKLNVDILLISRVLPAVFTIFSLFFTYKLVNYMTKNKLIAVLSVLLLNFSPRFLVWTTSLTAESLGHVFIPLTLYLFIKGDREGVRDSGRGYIIFAGLSLALLILTHHLSAFTFLAVLWLYGLISIKRSGWKKRWKNILLVTSIGLIFSASWWGFLLKTGIKNILVSEGYSFEGWRYFEEQLGFVVAYLGVASLVYTGANFFKARKSAMGDNAGLLLAWFVVPFIRKFDRDILKYLNISGEWFSILSPHLSARNFSYMAVPLSIMISITFVAFLYWISKRNRLVKRHNWLVVSAFCLVVLLFSFPFVFSVYYSGGFVGGSTLSEFFLDRNGFYWTRDWIKSFDENSDLETALWIKDNIHGDVNILADYEVSQVIYGVTGLKVANGGGALRLSLPIAQIYMDHLDIYFDEEPVAIAKIEKYNITHIVITDRMMKRSYFPVETYKKWDYSYGSGLQKANLSKFDSSDCFENIYTKDENKIFKVVC